MATLLETPSRIWRRIEAVEDRDMPSLPSVPAYEDSADVDPLTSRVLPQDSDEQTDEDDMDNFPSPKHSTPAASQYTSTIRALSISNSTARFSNSAGSHRSSFGFAGSRSSRSQPSRHSSIEFSKVNSLPKFNSVNSIKERSGLISDEEEESKSSVPDIYLPPPDDNVVDQSDEEDFSLTDALQSVSRAGSPHSFAVDAFEDDGTPKKRYDYSTSLKSEPKLSPFDKFRNIAIRKTAPRMRTPSLTHTLSSETSSPTNSTPHTTRSNSLSRSHGASPIPAAQIPLPPSATTSPAMRIESGPNQSATSESQTNEITNESMDIADARSSQDLAEENTEIPPTAGYIEERTQTAAEETEPTFSSDEAPTPYSNKQNSAHPFPSPSSSLGFTPTPAFPRPRARFNLPSVNEDVPMTPAQNVSPNQEHNDLMTPYSRRPSFLLSVIHSTARPRLKMGTPHPRYLATPSIVESTPGPPRDSSSEESSNLRTAFVGITPRPIFPARQRQSHPLAQTFVPSPAPSDTESATDHHNPYDSPGDHVSVISTTSSQDLTAHPRANRSFDPAMGFGSGAVGHGVGRFNAGKLNNYLNTLNRRLQEENEALLERLRILEAQKSADASIVSAPSSRRSSGIGANRRLSAGTALGDVEEDPAAERWLEEKAELEEMIESFKEEVTRCMAEKEEVETALENEKQERERDKERWKERMAEVEKGVSEVVADLEQRLLQAEKKAHEIEADSAAEIKVMNREIEELRSERDLANERAEKAEGALESGKDLGGALNEANERLAQASSDVRNANSQIRVLEKEIMEAEHRIDELESLHHKDQDLIAHLEDELTSGGKDLEQERAKLRELQSRVERFDEELHDMKAYVDELEESAEVAAEKIETLENELHGAQHTIKKLTVAETEAKQRANQLEKEVVKLQEVNGQMEDALEEAEKKMVEDGEALIGLRSEVAVLEREKQRVLVNASQNVSRSLESNGPTAEEIEALEAELDDAHKEIARLNAFVEQSPARKAMEAAKDARIEMLEREREELLERNKALRMIVNEVTTPNKLVNTSGISPIARHVLSMSIRAPRTPGGPLRELSWLNSTADDPSVSPLIAEISRLQRELNRANESIDDKLDKLEDAGMGVIGLTQKLEDAHTKIMALEAEIVRLKRTEERRVRRMERLRCQKCKVKVDLRQVLFDEDSILDASQDGLPSEPPTPPTRTTEALQQHLHAVNAELADLKEAWQEEKKKLVNEKAALQDAANRLNAQVKDAKKAAKRLAETERTDEKKRLTAESELEEARMTIQELEEDLRSERSRLRNLDTRQSQIQRDRDELMNQLKRTESDMEDVRLQLHKFKQENNKLEKELRENATVEQKARLLEKKVAENQQTIESLRQERVALSNDFKDLQRRYTEASERAARLRKEYNLSSSAHEQRRHQLDMHVLEIEDLKRMLKQQTAKVQKAEEEKDRVIAEKNDVSRTIAKLENDLKRVRKDAEMFGRDLKTLRTEKEKTETKYKDDIVKLERARKQAQARLKVVTQELEFQKEQSAKVKEGIRNHTCAVDDHQLSALKLQHNKECKGLIVQIRYLKAKFVRESSFRSDLGYQKKYLLVLLSQYEKSEENILACVARLGYPLPRPKSSNPNRLKIFGLLIIFVSRVRRASKHWKEQSASKQAIVAALEDVRRRRALAATAS